MCEFKIGDKVVAPTVFKGVGEVIELQELLNKNRYIVVNDGVRDWCFTEDGKLITFSTGTCDRDVVMFHAEIPSLSHYKEHDITPSLSLAEAILHVEKGGSVFHEDKPNLVLSFNLCTGLTFSDIKNNTLDTDILEVMMKELGSIKVKQKKWYVYEQQEAVECFLKRHDNVLVRNSDSSIWILAHFSRIRYDTGVFIYQCTYDRYKQMIPFKDNEYLLGTNKEPKVKYMIKE